MALKKDRTTVQGQIDKYMTTAAERGGLVSHVSTSSGVAMDKASNVVAYAASTSGAVAGVLMQDVVNIDQSKHHINFYRDEVAVGSKVYVLKIGEVVSDYITSGQNPQAGNPAYLGANGRFSVSGTVRVGKFETAKDEEGFSRITINIQ